MKHHIGEYEEIQVHAIFVSFTGNYLSNLVLS